MMRNSNSVIEIRRLGEFAVDAENKRTRGFWKSLDFISVEDFVMEPGSDYSIYFLALRAKYCDTTTDDSKLFRTAVRVPALCEDDTSSWDSLDLIDDTYVIDEREHQEVKVPAYCDPEDKSPEFRTHVLQLVANFAVLHHNEKYKLRQLELVDVMEAAACIFPDYVEYFLTLIVYDHAIAQRTVCKTEVVKLKRGDSMESEMGISYLYYYPFPDCITMDLVSKVRRMFQCEDFYAQQLHSHPRREGDDNSIHQLPEKVDKFS